MFLARAWSNFLLAASRLARLLILLYSRSCKTVLQCRPWCHGLLPVRPDCPSRNISNNLTFSSLRPKTFCPRVSTNNYDELPCNTPLTLSFSKVSPDLLYSLQAEQRKVAQALKMGNGFLPQQRIILGYREQCQVGSHADVAICNTLVHFSHFVGKLGGFLHPKTMVDAKTIDAASY